MPDRSHGVVKFFNDTKGWGFITADDGNGDVFVHRVDLNGVRMIAEGKRVTYTLEETRKGRKARDVMMV